MAKPVTLKTRLSYWFDNIMARGLWAKVGFLALITIIFILIMGIVATIAYGDIENMAPWVWWKAIMTSLGKGTPGPTDGPPVYVALMIIAMIYGMFFSSMLIGFIAGSIRDKVNHLAKGTSLVLEEGHTIVLGFNEETYVILGELIEANRNQRKPQPVVILGEESKEAMEDAITARFGKQADHPKTRFICRTGSVHDMASLKRCSLETCRSVIVSGGDDFETIKAIMACTYLLNSEGMPPETFAVAVIHESANADAAAIAGQDGREGDRLELLPLQEVLARIIVHTSRQPGLSKVYVELLNFTGNEFYTVGGGAGAAQLYGLTIREINLRLKDMIAVGIFDEERGIVLENPNEVVLEEGCSLIVVAEDDEELHCLPQPMEPKPLDAATQSAPQPLRCLVFGAEPILSDMLVEYARYLTPGSSVTVVTEEKRRRAYIPTHVADALETASVALDIRTVAELGKQEVFDIVDDVMPDTVVVLNSHNASSPEKEDAHTISLLLYVRECRSVRGLDFGITSEMLIGKNREIASATSPDDFIIGRHISGLLMSQIAQDRTMKRFFDTLLSAEGFEVYMKRASDYVPLGADVDMFSLVDAAAARGEILIGFQKKVGGHYAEPVINPAKLDASGALKSYRFGSSDRFVVLSENA